MRYRHHKYTWSNPFGNVRHQWELIGPRGGLHFHVSIYNGQATAGLEIHHLAPPDHMKDEAPSQVKCWLLNCPCWHDGTSLYASETLWPLIEGYMPRAEHDAIFRILEGEANTFFRQRDNEEDQQ